MSYIADAPNPTAWFILIVAVAIGAFLFCKRIANNSKTAQPVFNDHWKDEDLVF